MATRLTRKTVAQSACWPRHEGEPPIADNGPLPGHTLPTARSAVKARTATSGQPSTGGEMCTLCLVETDQADQARELPEPVVSARRRTSAELRGPFCRLAVMSQVSQ